MKQCAYVAQFPYIRLRGLGWAGHVVRHDELIVHKVLFSQVDLKRRGRHQTLVADLADDVRVTSAALPVGMPRY